jgi:excisionase family DNA binding protein
MELTVYCTECSQPVDYVKVKAAAKLLQVGEPYVRKLIRQGRLPGTAKYTPPGGGQAYNKIPVEAINAYWRAKEER